MFTKRTPKNNEIRSTSKNLNLRYQLLISALLWHIHPFLTSVDTWKFTWKVNKLWSSNFKAHLDELTWVQYKHIFHDTQLHPIMSNWLTGFIRGWIDQVLDLINHQIIQLSFSCILDLDMFQFIMLFSSFKPQLMAQINRDVDNE